jgi:hypothetical protein
MRVVRRPLVILVAVMASSNSRVGVHACSDLASSLECSICCSFLFRPATLHSCGHSYCSECLRDWTLASASDVNGDARCPICRHPIVSVSGMTEGLVENFALAEVSHAHPSGYSQRESIERETRARLRFAPLGIHHDNDEGLDS